MGINIFNMPVLETLLLKNDDPDFGKHIIPRAIRDWEVFSYIFNGYWHDIGTIRAFWKANLALTDPVSEFSFYESETTIYTHMCYLSPLNIDHCHLDRCLLSDGCIVSGKRIGRAIVGLRSIVGEGTVIKNTVLMGADFYEHGETNHPSGIPVGIG